MAQVPYQPVPTVTPESAPTPPFRIQTNSEMFGAGVGQALEGVGRDLAQAGNEFYSTAVKFRQLDIENEVNGATTDFFKQSGDLDNKFRLMEGSDPQKNLQTHVDDLEQTRQSIRQGLSSDFARKMFDRETMRRLGYDIVNASGYAATQAKQANKAARQATVDATIDTMVRDPNNEQGIDDGLRKIMGLTGQDSVDAGDSQPLRDAKVKVQLGRAVDSVAKSLAKTNPDAAKKFLEKYQDFTHSAQYQQTMEAVEQRGVTVRAEMEGARIATPIDAILDRAAITTREQESGGDYQHVTTTRRKDGSSQQALGAYGIMDRNLGEWSQEVLGHRVSKEEFLNSPEIQDQIYRAKMGQYIRRYGVEGAGRAWLGGEGNINNPDQRDALGTSVGDYGKVFATKVGSAVPSRNLGERSVQDMMQDAETSANLYYPNDPVRRQQYLDALQHNILARVSTQKRELHDRTIALQNSLTDTLNKTMANGRGPTSFEEAGALDPNFADHFEELYKLDPRIQGRVQQAFIKNGKADIPWTSEREAKYTQLIGMSDPELMQQDPNKIFNDGGMTLTQTNKILERQANIKHKAISFYHADTVLRQNGALLNDAQIFPSRTDTAANERYQHFRGAVIRRLEDYAAEHNAQMPQKEQDEMVKDLLKQVVTGHSFFGLFTNRESQYEVENQPETVISSQAEYDKLNEGQAYVWNGNHYRKRAK